MNIFITIFRNCEEANNCEGQIIKNKEFLKCFIIKKLSLKEVFPPKELIKGN